MSEKTAQVDWNNLGFGYVATPWRFQAEWRDGAWSKGELTGDPELRIAEGACALHYGQQCFEGLKAYPGPAGPLLFRPGENAARMVRSAERLVIPPVPPEMFLRGVRECVRANRELLPPHGSGATLYIRPFLIGVGENLGLRPASRYLFRVFCSPVGPYFKGGLQGIKLVVGGEDRVATRGTGAFKLGGNYAGGMLLHKQAKDAGYDEVLYLDSLQRRYLEEAGSANVFGILPGDPATFVTPASDSILPSITMKSLLVLAREELGLTVERRRVTIEEVGSFAEMGLTGTATVITPVASVHHDGLDLTMSEAPGPHSRKLYELLTGIQEGRIEDTRGWVVPVE